MGKNAAAEYLECDSVKVNFDRLHEMFVKQFHEQDQLVKHVHLKDERIKDMEQDNDLLKKRVSN